MLGIRKAEVSDDDEDDDRLDKSGAFGKLNLSEASVAIMRKWLALGRQRMVSKGRGPTAAGRAAAARKQKKKKPGLFGF